MSQLRTFSADQGSEYLEEYAALRRKIGSGEWSGEIWGFKGQLVPPPKEVTTLLFGSEEGPVQL